MNPLQLHRYLQELGHTPYTAMQAVQGMGYLPRGTGRVEWDDVFLAIQRICKWVK